VKPLRIATRGSALALWQANHLRQVLESSFGLASEILVIKTSGDGLVGAAFEELGIRGVFIKELEIALLDGRADLAIHSMKDVPTEICEACRVAIVFTREDPRDALVSRSGLTLAQLPRGARMGTSSLRRASQLLRFRSDFDIVEIRGNVDTRLRKLDSGEYDGVILAKAGLDRLGLASRITEILSPEVMLSAVGQGALGVEYFDARGDEFAFLRKMGDLQTIHAVQAERGLLAGLQGGCRLPLGAWARFEEGELVIDACVLSADGKESLRQHGSTASTAPDEPRSLGLRVANELLAAGADRLLRLAGRSVASG